MSEPIKHHFVPQIYLKRFCLNKNGDLFVLKSKTKYPEKVKICNKSQICYEPHRYTFDNSKIIKELKIEDPNIIEKTCFSYENFDLENLFDKIDHHRKFFKTEFEKLIRILIDIKLRNPVFSERFNDFDPTSESSLKEIEKTKNLAIDYCIGKGFKEDLVDLAIQEVQKKFRDDNYKQNVYRNGIFSNNEVKEELIQKLLDWEADVYYTSYENPFITSDNPGFTLNSKNEIFNTEFDFIDAFVFPISPKSILILRKSDKKSLEIYQNIQYKKTNIKTLLSLNQATVSSSKEIIIGQSKEQLLISLNS